LLAISTVSCYNTSSCTNYEKKGANVFPKTFSILAQNMFELLLKVCWKSSRFWAVFGASQGKISSRQELEVDLTHRDTNERGFKDGASSM